MCTKKHSHFAIYCRSVVTIPLSRIETNQELMDIMFDQSFPVRGEDMPVKLSFKDVIFVMEDVDAASSVVLSRTLNDDTEKSKEDDKRSVSGSVNSSTRPNLSVNQSLSTSKCALGPHELPIDPSIASDTSVPKLTRQHTRSSDSVTLEEELLGIKTRNIISDDGAEVSSRSLLKQVIQRDVNNADVSPITTATTAISAAISNQSGCTQAQESIQTPGDGKSQTDTGLLMMASLMGEVLNKKVADTSGIPFLLEDKEEKKEKALKADKLDLSGLLNVLDGVVDTPGR